MRRTAGLRLDTNPPVYLNWNSTRAIQPSVTTSNSSHAQVAAKARAAMAAKAAVTGCPSSPSSPSPKGHSSPKRKSSARKSSATKHFNPETEANRPQLSSTDRSPGGTVVGHGLHVGDRIEYAFWVEVSRLTRTELAGTNEIEMYQWFGATVLRLAQRDSVYVQFDDGETMQVTVTQANGPDSVDPIWRREILGPRAVEQEPPPRASEQQTEVTCAYAVCHNVLPPRPIRCGSFCSITCRNRNNNAKGQGRRAPRTVVYKHPVSGSHAWLAPRYTMRRARLISSLRCAPTFASPGPALHPSTSAFH